MPTINQLAARIANTMNQPTNAELIERAKDMVRSAFAVKVKESIRKEGVREILTTSFAVTVLRANFKTFIRQGIIVPDQSDTNVAYITEHPVCTPIDITNDAPFISVRIDKGSVPYNAIGTPLSHLPLLPVGIPYYYSIINKYLVITDNRNLIGTATSEDVYVDGIFEDPSYILTRSGDPDNVELPIPNSLIEDMMYGIFRVNFNMYPKNIEINVNKDQIQQSK